MNDFLNYFSGSYQFLLNYWTRFFQFSSESPGDRNPMGRRYESCFKFVKNLSNCTLAECMITVGDLIAKICKFGSPISARSFVGSMPEIKVKISGRNSEKILKCSIQEKNFATYEILVFLCTPLILPATPIPFIVAVGTYNTKWPIDPHKTSFRHRG